jgi:hypothetical protein
LLLIFGLLFLLLELALLKWWKWKFNSIRSESTTLSQSTTTKY